MIVVYIAVMALGGAAIAGVSTGDTAAPGLSTGLSQTGRTGETADSAFGSGDTGWGSGDTGNGGSAHSGAADTSQIDTDPPEDTDSDTGATARDTSVTSFPSGTTASDLADEGGGSPWSEGCSCATGADPVGLGALLGALSLFGMTRRREKVRQLG